MGDLPQPDKNVLSQMVWSPMDKDKEQSPTFSVNSEHNNNNNNSSSGGINVNVNVNMNGKRTEGNNSTSAMGERAGEREGEREDNNKRMKVEHVTAVSEQPLSATTNL